MKTKWDIRRLKVKLARWQRAVDADQEQALKEYGAVFVKRAIRFTPPARPGKGGAAGAALRGLRDRIRVDIEGDAEVSVGQHDIRWITLADGTKKAIFKTNRGRNKYPSPFIALRGQVPLSVLRTLHVGKYGVKLVRDPGAYMASQRGNYQLRQPSRGAAYLSWHGPRHVAREADLRRETERRQSKVGRLLAGWKAVAVKVGVKLPAAAARQPGAGSCVIRRSRSHQAALEARNFRYHPHFGRIVRKNMKGVQSGIRRVAKKRGKVLKNKLSKI